MLANTSTYGVMSPVVGGAEKHNCNPNNVCSKTDGSAQIFHGLSQKSNNQ